ncbi:type II toxin-antitoxin system PemK/MazF family toxin [Sedimentitalea sp. HM32M-2]|uniref:type II toxin-antitoxin system PemK/MazF family toxin n=1 Tax=Sedimentitalea sp. HM32M-2 TaxID=3351566 RepID=UPI003637CDA9
MFQRPQTFVPAPDWATAPQRGDIVLFRFPVAEDDARIEPSKRRPCLVLDTFARGQDRFVELACGTSSGGPANRGYGFFVRQPQSQAHAGLTRPTRFVCARRITVHCRNREIEGLVDGSSPLIGRLDDALVERMNAVRAWIQAEADIAAHHREEKRREQARWAREDRDFR